MHYRLEAWSLPGTGPFVKKLGHIPAVAADLQEPDDDWGYGSVEIPSSHLLVLDTLLKVDPTAPSSNVGTLIVAYDDDSDPDEPAFEFVARYRDNKITEEGTHLVRIHGPGIGWGLNQAIAYPWSTLFPDWVWGGRELLQNGDFEDGTRGTEFALWHTGDGGDITLDIEPEGFASQQAVINWDDDGEAVRTAINGTNVVDCRVTGTGTEDDPWEVTITNPLVPTSVGIFGHTITNGSPDLDVTAGGGNTDPSPWVRSYNPQTGQLHGTYSSDGFRLTEDDEPSEVIEGTRSLRVNGLTQFSGAQQDIDDPEIGGIPLWARATVRTLDPDNRFRLVIRDLNEIPIDTTPETTVPTDTPTVVSLDDIRVRDNAPGILFRFANTRPDHNPQPFSLDNCSLREGLAPTTVGDMGIQLIDHAQARGTLTWVEPTWTATLDSNGDAWDADDLELRIARGMKYGNHVWAKFRELGYEWLLRRKPGEPGTWLMDMFNPGGRGTDRTAAPNTQHPSFIPGHIIDGDAPARAPRFTHILAEAPDNVTYETGDAVQEGIWGRTEEYLPDQNAHTEATLQREADQRLTDELDNLIGYKATYGGDTVLPRRHVDIGDTCWWHIPHTATRHARRISAIRWKLRVTREGERVWTVEYTASRVHDPETAKSIALRRLITKYEGLTDDRGGRRRGGRAVGSTVLTGAHTHLELLGGQTIAAAGTALAWTGTYPTIPTDNMPAPSFPVAEVEAEIRGYYNVDIAFGWDGGFAGGGRTEVIRHRGRAQTVVWPPVSDPGLWDVAQGTHFTGVAPAIPLDPEDRIEVRVVPGDGASHDITTGHIAIYLVHDITAGGEDHFFSYGEGSVAASTPGTTQEGDLLLAFIYSAEPTVTTPAGWTRKAEEQNPPPDGFATQDGRYILDWKIATGADLGSTSRWDVSGGSGETDVGVLMVRIPQAEVDTAAPFDSAVDFDGPAENTGSISLEVTSATDNALLIAFGGSAHDSASSHTWGGMLTRHVQAGLSGERISASYATLRLGTAGATGAKPMTASPTPQWIGGFLVALKPSP